jgi:glycosyltransferase involved in cell wall biosynthesis
MHLLIIGHTAHYLKDGQIVGWGPTVREVNWLARAFDRVTHLASFHPGPAPASALPYDTDRVRCAFVDPAGGLDLRKKLQVLLAAPQYVQAIQHEIPRADVIQVRCPGSLGLYGMILASLYRKKPRWTKYAGNWIETGKLPPSFAFQRWWLKSGLSRGPITVNGRWPGQPGHIFSFDNPSLSIEEIEMARNIALEKRLEAPARLVFVGNVEEAKGTGIALLVVKRLLELGFDLRFDLVGDGPQRSHFEQMSADLGLGAATTFHGWVPHERVKQYLNRAHFILLPSQTEGWPKVLSEAMAYGVAPVASQVSAIPQILDETGAGFALPPQDIAGLSTAIAGAIRQPERWKAMSLAGIAAAPRFSYERYLVALDEMFRTYYGDSPMKEEVIEEVRGKITGLGDNRIGRLKSPL